MPTPSAAETAIQQSKDAFEQFLQTANDEVYTPRAAQSNAIAASPATPPAAPPAAAGTTAAPAPAPAAPPPPAAGPQRGSDGRFVKVEPEPSAAPAQVPGVPPVSKAEVAPAPAAPPDQFADVPGADALDKPGTRLRSNDWRRLHAKAEFYAQQANEAQTLKKEVETLRAQLTGAPAAQQSPDLTTLQSERDRLAAELEAVAVERSPRFEQMFKPRQEAAIAQAKEAVGPVKAAQIADLLAMPRSAYRDEQIAGVLAELPLLQQHELSGAVAELNRINSERQSLASQGQKLYQQWRAEEQATAQRQQQERQKTVASTFDRVSAEWKKAIPDLDDNSLTLAKDVFMGQRSLDEVAQAAMWTAYGPRAAATALKLQQELAAANAELARLRNVQPGTANDAGGFISNDDAPAATGLEGLIQSVVRSGVLR